MPIISNFPTGSGGSGGLALAAVSGISTLVSSGKVYVKWTDPEDLVVADSTLATWSGTLLVRKAGSVPASRRDGTVVLDSKTRNEYQNSYFCDSGLTDGVTYYYKFFPYTTTNTYTDSTDDEFSATPEAIKLGNVSGMSAVAAGNGKLDIKWTDPASTVVQDGITVATWANTTVVVKAGSYATSPDDDAAAYRLVCTTRNQYSSTALTVTGLTNGTTYYISFFPISTDGAVNTDSSNRVSGVANRMTIASVPSQSGSLTYSGSAQSPSWSNYDTTKMTIGGTTSGTNAGSYTATFTPKDDYQWSDGSTAAKSVSWSIAKAAGSLSISPTSITLNMTNTSGTITVTRSGDGAISAVSNNTGVATVTVSGNTITVNNVNQTNGSATITVSVAEGTNYTAPSSKTCSVTASFVSTTLNDNTWAVIKSVSDAGQGANYWSVGDKKSITINGTVGTLSLSNLSVDVFILGFNHNSSYEGTNRIHFQIGKISSTMVGLCDSKYGSYATDGTKYFNMNHWGNYNYGGWAGCDLRYDVLGSTDVAPSGYGSAVTTSRVGYNASATCATNPVANTLMAALPADLRAVMKGVTKYADAVGNSSNVAANVKAFTDYLFLLAEFEVQGARTYANQYEQNYQLQYDYYKSGNSKIAYKHDATTTAAYWWLRSPGCNYTNTFCDTFTDGTAYYYFAGYSGVLLPGFAV